jgi:hypothetical protein
MLVMIEMKRIASVVDDADRFNINNEYHAFSFFFCESFSHSCIPCRNKMKETVEMDVEGLTMIR